METRSTTRSSQGAVEPVDTTDDAALTGSTMTTAAGREQPLAEAGRETVQTAGQLVERATNTGLRQADRGREQTAEGLHQLAGEIRTISTDMETQQPAIATVAEVAADQTERIATYLRDTDVRQIIASVEGVARRQPLLFIGGAFVLGLAAARFLKAAGGGQAHIRSYRVGTYDYGTSGNQSGLSAYDVDPVDQSARL